MMRTELLGRLAREPFDVLVVGGGILGAGIARDAAMRGLRVALVERGDFAGGTSSKTSKLIHGGLRYLEHGQFRLVAESVRERHVLRGIAPQLVTPLPLMIPMYRGDLRSPLEVRIGLWLYDAMAGRRAIRRHQMLSARKLLAAEPSLNPVGLRGAALFGDCQMDDARLCLMNILQAISFGAVCCNYVGLLRLETVDGQLRVAVVENRHTGQAFEIKAAAIVNATGPWSDAIRRLSDSRARPRVAPVKGIHLVVPRTSRQALFVPVRRDGRMIFILPWGEHSLIGTTESRVVEPLDALRAQADEVDYLLAEVGRVLPQARLSVLDVIATFAGARPLLGFSGSATSASREDRIEIDRFGLVSVMGGKFTTFRAIAGRAVDLLVKRFRFTAQRSLTSRISLIEPTEAVVLDRWKAAAQRLPVDVLTRLLRVYGPGAFRILRLLEFEPALAQPVCPHHAHILAELVYSMQEELACTVSDLLIRRTTIAYSRCHGLDLLPALRDLAQRYAHCAEERWERDVADYRRWLAESLAFRRDGQSTLSKRPDGVFRADDPADAPAQPASLPRRSDARPLP